MGFGSAVGSFGRILFFVRRGSLGLRLVASGLVWSGATRKREREQKSEAELAPHGIVYSHNERKRNRPQK